MTNNAFLSVNDNLNIMKCRSNLDFKKYIHFI